MKPLNNDQMLAIEGGSTQAVSCAIGLIGFAAATIGLVTLTAATGGLAAFAAVAGFSVAPAGAALACLT